MGKLFARTNLLARLIILVCVATLPAVAVIAYRDVLKFLRDRPRLISTLIFPFVFVGALGGSLQANLGATAGYNFMTFVFTGV